MHISPVVNAKTNIHYIVQGGWVHGVTNARFVTKKNAKMQSYLIRERLISTLKKTIKILFAAKICHQV